ncbi:hypothetical protein DPMN_039671 [Dreissena polymorpha]|uniref:Uncharacterized protein n=1 Tax=Dreissena polymorpha TaxID=45954 RepID=A0A9D4CTN2_DREPO|nr:hypothetical protein DPMN_039671 [Dreissena polymorpha]
MNSQSTLQIGKEVLPVSPQLLFQRFLVAASVKTENRCTVFTHELCPVPASLFDDTGCKRAAQYGHKVIVIQVLRRTDTWHTCRMAAHCYI